MSDNTSNIKQSFIDIMNTLNFNLKNDDLLRLQEYLQSRNNARTPSEKDEPAYRNGVWDTTIYKG